MKQIRVRISDEIYEKIMMLSKQKSTNKSALINSAILAFLNKENKLLLSENSKEKLTHIIQLKTSNDEFNLLKQKAKIDGFNSVKKECRFLLINALYDENFLSKVELNNFKEATASFNKVSKDIWYLIKLVRDDAILDIKENFKGFEPYFNEINKALESYKKDLDIVSKKTQKRIS